MTQRFRRNSHVCFLSSHQLTSRSCRGRTGRVTLTTLSIFLSWEFVLSLLVFYFFLVSFFLADILHKLTHEYFFRQFVSKKKLIRSRLENLGIVLRRAFHHLLLHSLNFGLPHLSHYGGSLLAFISRKIRRPPFFVSLVVFFN